MIFRHSDHVASDDLDAVLEMSREEHEIMMSGISSVDSSHANIQEWKDRIAEIDANRERYEDDIRSTRAVMALERDEREMLMRNLESAKYPQGKGKAKGGLDYGAEQFEWSRGLKAKMKTVFGIDSFRLCQEGVCNANMDGRDIVCVMPTGGGKSLTYQLPALLQRGCTLVISPLISLITDQILHLEEAGIQAVKLTGGTSKAQSTEINQRLLALAGHKVESKDQEIKLCYVTPEKIAKSKSFLSLLQKLDNGSQLARIVIDEAHCVSQLGHDFRPDYQKLHILRQLFPRVPIMALSATCPPKVLDDLIKTLGLNQVVDGRNAQTQGTVYFSAPLYRKNLHYRVVPKPAKGADVMKAMTDYILEHHLDESGIVYCLSKKDADGVADALRKLSEGKIRTGVYHSDVQDGDKERLHVFWRSGAINVVCATIAFGLGIDKGDVRFVLHHSLSKSLEGFYQESGRAGRDGKDSDCILYYRPQDGTTLSSMVAHEKEGRDKLRSMLSFAQNFEQCRKVQFAKYFSVSSQLAMSSWTTSESGALARCGHCDNCTRSPEELEHRDVTIEAWQLLKITDAVNADGANLTLNMLTTLARGFGRASYEVTRGGKGRKGKGKGKEKEKVDLDLDAVAEGVVDLTKEEIEHLLVEMLIQRYLDERYSQTMHTTNVYLARGPLAARLTRHAREDLKDIRDSEKVKCVFRKRGRKSKGDGKAGPSKAIAKVGEAETSKITNYVKGSKRKRDVLVSDEDEEEDVIVVSDDDDLHDTEDGVGEQQLPNRRQLFPCIARKDDADDDGDDDDDDIDEGWSHTMRPKASPPSKRRKSSGSFKMKKAGRQAGTVIQENNVEILVLSESD